MLNGAMDAWNLQVDALETSVVLPNNAYIDNTRQVAKCPSIYDWATVLV
jgi:hypothetical protein